MSTVDIRPAGRRSPLDGWFADHVERWLSIGEHAEPAAFAASVPRGDSVTLVDRSLRDRFGCKGPEAEAWLSTVDCAPPAGANRWHLRPSGVLVARLATSEFLIEEPRAQSAVSRAAALVVASPVRPTGVYPVVRQDCVIEMSGPRLIAFLQQICNVDFMPVIGASDDQSGPVVLTSIIGVSAVAIARARGSAAVVTLWVDPSFAHYFWTTLLGVATGLGGGAGIATHEHTTGEGS